MCLSCGSVEYFVCQVVNGYDLKSKSRTGSGKMFAFVIAITETLDLKSRGHYSQKPLAKLVKNVAGGAYGRLPRAICGAPTAGRRCVYSCDMRTERCIPVFGQPSWPFGF